MATQRAFWIIVQGATPTAFRARQAEDLLPTLHQLQRKQPDTVLRWFERGRFWESPEAAREASIAARRATQDRNRDWRPGGNHADPRARFKISRDEKRARFKARQQRSWDRSDETAGGDRPPRPPRAPREQRPWNSQGSRGPQGKRPWGSQAPRGPQDRRDPGSRGAKGPKGPRDQRGPRPDFPHSKAEGGGPKAWRPGGARRPGQGRFHSRGPRRPKGPRGPKGGR